MNKTRKEIIIGRTFGILSAVAYAVNAVLVRKGLADMASPLVGASVSLLAGALVLSMFVGMRPESNLIKKKTSVLLLFMAGLASGVGALSSYFALSKAPVTIVSPIQSTYPLFVLLWTRLFLSRFEKISLRLVLGTFLVVGGIAMIAIGKGS